MSCAHGTPPRPGWRHWSRASAPPWIPARPTTTSRTISPNTVKHPVEIQYGLRQSVAHERVVDPSGRRITLREHRPERGQGIKRTDPHPEEKAITEAAPELAAYVAELKQRSRKLVVLALRQLLRMVREYPREPLLGAIEEASRYGLYDLDRIERMVLRAIAREYFLLNDWKGTDPGDE